MQKLLFLFILLISFSTLTLAQKVRVEVEQPVPISENDTVYGTLLSRGKSISKYNNIPLLIIIPGSGPTDRNGNSALLNGPNDSYKQLADSLLSQGIATFRYDKPAIGKSTFSKKEEDMRFDDNIDVVLKIIDNMEDLGFDHIFLLGHSQGSLIAMLAAQKTKIDGVISLAGAGHDALTLIKKQLVGKLPENLEKQTIQKLDSIKQGYTVEKYNVMVSSLIRKSLQPYLYSYFKYDPAVEIKKLKAPVLILQGGRDMQINEDEGERLHQAKPDARYIVYPEMNHVLKRVDESEAQNTASYYDADFPLTKSLPRDIADWVKDRK
ncbi:MAG: alpha/beta fold hydrolase [Owenweeksia sp.]